MIVGVARFPQRVTEGQSYLGHVKYFVVAIFAPKNCPFPELKSIKIGAAQYG
jgi:hypothetical protein